MKELIVWAVEEYALSMKEEGILEGEKRGIKKGVKEGVKKGKIEGKMVTIRNLLKKNMPLEEALECAELDRATYDKYASDIQ